MRRTPFSLAVLPLLALALLAGCGGSSHPATTTAATTTAAAPTTTAASTSAASTTAAPTSTGTSSGLGGLASIAKCSQLAGLYAAVASALTGASNNIQKEQQVLEQFAAKTPPAIRADFQTLAAAFTKIAGAYKGGGSNPASLAKLAALAQQLNTPALTQAEHAISTWATQNCHA